MILRPHGCECTCEDWTYRRSNQNVPCKHIDGLTLAGLMAKEVVM